MSMNVGADSEEEPGVMATINTTPLVDVMLVLLIIFLITIPVITKTVPVKLPHANNQPTKTKPGTITIAVDQAGTIFWNDQQVPNDTVLLQKVEQAALQTPQPDVHIRGDRDADYKSIGHVLYELQRGGMVKIAFITQPSAQEMAAGAQ